MLEIGFDIALRKARDLDEYFRVNGRLAGPLHGIPLTLKDQFHVKGLETCMGYVGWVDTFEGQRGTNKERNSESELIREFNMLGAVVIGKVPATLSLLELLPSAHREQSLYCVC